MSGNTIGGKKAAKTNLERYGKDFYKTIAAKGGRVSGIKKGFALMTPEQRSEAGRKGGALSKRGTKR
jgi:general stress protein YciG